MIKKGVLETDNQPFQQFKRQNVTRWGTISQILSLIEKWIGQYNITYAYVSAQKLVEYSEYQLDKYTDEDLLECMQNKGQILQVTKVP